MESSVTLLLAGVGLLFLILACFGWGQPRVFHNIEHWEHAVPGLDEAADLFYARVYQRLKERLALAALPDSKIGFGPGHLFGNGTIFGARPQYLIIRYDFLVVYVYAFRLDSALFVSYWAFSKYTLWAEHPLLRYVPVWRYDPLTLYRYDVMTMCLTLIRASLQEVIDSYCEERGLKPLEEFEKRPVLQSFYAKYKLGAMPQNGYVMPLQHQPVQLALAQAGPGAAMATPAGMPLSPDGVASTPQPAPASRPAPR
ncbi:MAG: hypothetical protein JO316_05385 [Abitibacteriaceae bacterium]|nr:hypothetical protein [Abditibacteriaceae bacterium]